MFGSKAEMKQAFKRIKGNKAMRTKRRVTLLNFLLFFVAVIAFPYFVILYYNYKKGGCKHDYFINFRNNSD